jgi:hypothetical protein
MYQYIPVYTVIVLSMFSMYRYVAPVANMLGRVAGNCIPTIPHMFSKHKRAGSPMSSANTAAADGRRGRNV